jgi:hypothetical protein
MFRFLKRWLGVGNDILVEFIDDESQKPFFQERTPLDRLPASFDVETTVEVAGNRWIVVKADPVQSAHALRSRRLKLWVRKLQKLDPSKLLFGLPTINDSLPQGDDPRATPATLFRLAEGDWRQVEFVSLAFLPKVEETFGEIQQVLATQRQGAGFRNVHLRTGIGDPLLPCGIEVADLESRLAFPAAGLQIERWVGQVKGGFAYALEEAVRLYGNQEDGIVKTLGLHPGSYMVREVLSGIPPHSPRVSQARVDQLQALATDFELCLVDWCRCMMFRSFDLPAYFKDDESTG